MKSVATAIMLTAAMGGVVVLAGRDVPTVHHETVYLADAATTRPATQPAAKAANTLCLVNPEHEVDPDVVVIHDGQAYAFCCDDCVAKFKENPKQYLPKAK